MPCLTVLTSGGTKDADYSAFLAAASKLVADTLGKPEQYVTVRVETAVKNMIFGGTDAPCAHATLQSIGALSPEVNARFSAGLSELLSTHFSVDANRYYLFFSDVERHNCGWSGRTFA